MLMNAINVYFYQVKSNVCPLVSHNQRVYTTLLQIFNITQISVPNPVANKGFSKSLHKKKTFLSPERQQCRTLLFISRYQGGSEPIMV